MSWLPFEVAGLNPLLLFSELLPARANG